ncbi:ABC transporter permease [Luteipulveratus sp. YIM 133132]|uniref:ABC transporter permease n=1 Tax=Luteipulveratus flavus TaxID=3031728 RepID=UPI0023B16A01|nr:ABC transporter permease [Luteipulveratus sp. YIM 133132]MDE9365781.1 ABC transporter permease [Luteipulveratus sp. YIM 133132]
MLRYVVRRIGQMIGVLFLLSVLLFVWLRALPGGPVSAICGERCTPPRRAAIEKTLGMDQPVLVQYFSFLKRAVTGDFGLSTKVDPGREVTAIFMERLPGTLELSLLAMIIAIAVGIPLGYMAAKRRGGILDGLSLTGSLIGVAVPVFFTAFILKYFFAIEWHLFPVTGRQSDLDATRITNFFVLDGLLTREWDAAWDAFKHLILPAITLSTIPFAFIFRITRGAVSEVLEEDYVRTAEAKGLTAKVVNRRHVLRNALLPVVTIIGLQTGALLGGAVLTEFVFGFPGLGDALATASRDKDFAMLQLLILAAAAAYVLVNLLVDIAYAYIDPRVRTR